MTAPDAPAKLARDLEQATAAVVALGEQHEYWEARAIQAETERDEARAVAEGNVTIDSWLSRRAERAEAGQEQALQRAAQAEDAIERVRAVQREWSAFTELPDDAEGILMDLHAALHPTEPDQARTHPVTADTNGATT